MLVKEAQTVRCCDLFTLLRMVDVAKDERCVLPKGSSTRYEQIGIHVQRTHAVAIVMTRNGVRFTTANKENLNWYHIFCDFGVCKI